MKLGLIGAGSIAGAHLKAAAQISGAAQVVALADPNAANLQRQSARFNIPRTYADPAELFAAPDLEGVILTTPHDTHAPLTLAALRAGKHVLVEKPMACSLAECDAMNTAAQVADKTLMVAQCQRYDAGHQALKQLIASGELGRLRAARIDVLQNAAAFLPTGHWLYDGKQAGGGIVISVAVHKLDLLRYLVGDVTRVTAICQTTNPAFSNGAEDLALATLEFANGTVGQLFASWSAYRLRYSENMLLFGDTGAAHALPATETHVGPFLVASQRRSPAAERGWPAQFGGFAPVAPVAGMSADSFVNQLAHFAECCRRGTEPLSSGRDNRRTMQVIFAIYESARTRRPVDVM